MRAQQPLYDGEWAMQCVREGRLLDRETFRLGAAPLAAPQEGPKRKYVRCVVLCACVSLRRARRARALRLGFQK
jgi:hypothetical protein